MSIQFLVVITLVIIISLKVKVKFIMQRNMCPLSVLRRSLSAFFWTKLVLFKLGLHLRNIDRWMSLVINVIHVLWTLIHLFLKYKNKVCVKALNKDACLQQWLTSTKDTSLEVAVLCCGDRILHINFVYDLIFLWHATSLIWLELFQLGISSLSIVKHLNKTFEAGVNVCFYYIFTDNIICKVKVL